MKPITVFLCILFLSLGLAVNVPIFGHARQSNALSTTVIEFANVSYCSPIYQDLIDIYVPNDFNLSSTQYPVVLYIHGGGWTGGNKMDKWSNDMYPQIVNAGMIFASISYRLAPNYVWPSQIQDVSCAVRFLKANANQYHINSSRVGIFGASAGGQLALVLAFTQGASQWGGSSDWNNVSANVQAVADWFGPANLTIRSDFDSNANSNIATEFGTSISHLVNGSAVYYVTNEAPPTLIEHGINDTHVLIHQSIQLDSILNSSSVTNSFIQVDNAGHNWAHFTDPSKPQMTPSLAQVEQNVVNWFVNYL